MEHFQGQERQVIIFSTVRSGRSSGAQRSALGFVGHPKRLNVAVSRPPAPSAKLPTTPPAVHHTLYDLLRACCDPPRTPLQALRGAHPVQILYAAPAHTPILLSYPEIPPEPARAVAGLIVVGDLRSLASHSRHRSRDWRDQSAAL